MKKVQIEDCQNIGNLDFIDWEQFRDSTILITGATGLIGSNLVNAIAYNSRQKGLDMKLILPVRNIDVADMLFGWTKAEIIPYILGTELKIEKEAEYIVHLASPTSSKFFSEKPVDTMVTNMEGIKALLEWAVKHPVKKFINLSTMEVYGFPKKGHKVKENELGSFDPMNSRNSYPIAKLACEALCNSYHSQFGVPAVTLRATQTFGPGVKYDDGRVFAQFMRCAIEKKEIVLKSDGLTERSYLYTADAVSAILVSMIKAKAGESYTVANPDTYCSIKEMAQMMGEKVVFDIAKDITTLGYAETLFMDLDVRKMEGLGWSPKVDLQKMFKRMIRGIGEDE